MEHPEQGRCGTASQGTEVQRRLCDGQGVDALQELKGMFMTKQEAEQRAAELKCKGPLAMGYQWMACANEQVLHKALQNE
jgi:hypothetical protein